VRTTLARVLSILAEKMGEVSNIFSRSVADPGCFCFYIPDPNFFHSGSRIRVKEFKYCNPPKKCYLSSQKYDPGCSSRIRILIFLPIPDPGVKKAPDPDPHHGPQARDPRPFRF
jgi:hypothetical protein